MQPITLRYIAFCLLMLLGSVIAYATPPVVLQGKITDQDNKPVEFATVKIKGTATGTTSGLDGAYRLSTASADTLVVVFSCIGYGEESRTLINPSGTVTLNMRMRENTKMLSEVQVTEIKKQTGAMQRIDAQGDYRLAADATGGSVESMLATMGGVSTGNEMSSQYSVRGGTYDENSVYINGIEVYRPQLISSGQQEGLSVINPDMVGAIGFSTGGFTAEYADKMSSALDITYRQPEAFEGMVSGSLMGASLSVGQSAKKFNQLHGLRYKRNNSLLSSLETRGEYDPNFLDYQTSINLTLSPRWRMNVLGNIAVNNYKFTPVNRSTNFGTANDAKQFTVYFDGQEKDRFETFFGAYTLTFQPSKAHVLQLLASGFLTNELVAYDISGEYWLDQAGTAGGSVGGELGVGRYHEHARNRLKSSVIDVGLKGTSAIGHHQLNYGISVKAEHVTERSREWERRDSAGYSLPTHPDLLQVVYNLSSTNDLSSTRATAFVADQWRVPTSVGYLSLNGGVRFSYWSFNKEMLLSPRLNVGFIPEQNASWAFRFATGLYYQAPYYKEVRMTLSDGMGNNHIVLNSDIKSQRSIHIVAGADYTFRAFNRPFKVSAEMYYKVLSNLVPFELENLKIVYSGRNESSGYVAGLDMKLFGQFVPGSDSWLSFSLMKSQENLHGVKVPRPNDRRYNVALYFTDYFPKFPKLKFSLRGIFSDGLPAILSHGSRDQSYFRTPAYKRIDIGLNYALLTDDNAKSSSDTSRRNRTGLRRYFRSIWLGLDCFNLFDFSNVSSYYWVTDVNNLSYAVPNYLTRRQFNAHLTISF